MTQKVSTDLLLSVASSVTDDTTAPNAADAGKVVQLNAQGGIPSVYFAPMVQQWTLTANTLGNQDPLSSNIAVGEKLGGDSMSLNAGIFTFPRTGIYRIEAQVQLWCWANNGDLTFRIHKSTDVDEDIPTWSVLAQGSESGVLTVPATYGNIGIHALFDVTDVTTHGIKFSVQHTDQNNAILGDATYATTFFTFTRLGDT